MLIASDKRWALMTETHDDADPRLEDLIARLDLGECDIVLVEGFRHVPFANIELHRPALGKDLIFTEDKSVIAVASDEKIVTGDLPLLDLNKPRDVVAFISNWLSQENNYE